MATYEIEFVYEGGNEDGTDDVRTWRPYYDCDIERLERIRQDWLDGKIGPEIRGPGDIRLVPIKSIEIREVL